MGLLTVIGFVLCGLLTGLCVWCVVGGLLDLLFYVAFGCCLIWWCGLLFVFGLFIVTFVVVVDCFCVLIVLILLLLLLIRCCLICSLYGCCYCGCLLVLFVFDAGGVFCCCRWLSLLVGVLLVPDAVVVREFWYLVVLIWFEWVSVGWLGCLVGCLVCGLCIVVVSLSFSCCSYD